MEFLLGFIVGLGCVLAKQFADSLGWVNMYRTCNGRIMISQIPKATKEEARTSGLLEAAASRYIGTYRIYK